MRALIFASAIMYTYQVETDGMNSFVVKVARPDGTICLTSPHLATLSETRKWIDEHQKSVARIAASSKSA
jgi:hypothetical protein